MRDYEFEREVFDKQWAIFLTAFQYAFAIGFVLSGMALALDAATILHIPAPKFFVWLLLISVVGFPIVSLVKEGYSRLLRWSELKERDGRIYYDRVVRAKYTGMGRVEEYHVYEIRKVTSTRTTRRHLIIEGDIRKAVVSWNKTMLFSENISSMKIPRAYEDMDTLEALKQQELGAADF